MKHLIITILAVLLCFSGCEAPQDGTSPPISVEDLISQVSEAEILATATALQNFITRRVGYQGNTNAGTYVHDRFAAIPGLSVVYQGGDLRNVVATLPGTDGASDNVYIVGAHYDSTSDTPANAPGATDNACGVGIVLELARIMSKSSFKHDVKFAAWNSEETGIYGSSAYVSEADMNHENIVLYFNYDSSAYDPDGRLILDIMSNDLSSGIATLMSQRNGDYKIGLAITHNVHTCYSDHRPFWDHGYCAVMTHCENHGPAHSTNDTVDKISSPYAKKNGQLGLAILAELAGMSTTR